MKNEERRNVDERKGERKEDDNNEDKNEITGNLG